MTRIAAASRRKSAQTSATSSGSAAQARPWSDITLAPWTSSTSSTGSAASSSCTRRYAAARSDGGVGPLARRAQRAFAAHPQTPLPPETRAAFTGLPYFDYDPELRVLAAVEPAERVQREIATSGERPYSFTRFARAVFASMARDCPWTCTGWTGTAAACISASPTRRAATRPTAPGGTSSTPSRAPTSAARRGKLVLDFNFAYNPSCCYDPRWVCPLAPPGNRLPIAIRGGERYPL